MENQEEDENNESSQGINVIQLLNQQSYGNELTGTSTQSENTGAIKSKYYKQTYRTAWENMPDFRGWLRGVYGEPTRAYCLYCQKSLHAHRLSLLKHTCTIRHQKAAQIHNFRKIKANMARPQEIAFASTNTSEQEELQGDEDVDAIIEYAKADDPDGDEGEVEDCEVDEEENVEQEEEIDEEDEDAVMMKPFNLKTYPPKKVANTMSSIKPPISTHVLDTCKGVAVAGLQVSLYKLIDGRWTYINEGLTNTDGRFADFLERSDFTPGRYKLHFDVDRFFEAKKQDTLYPFVEIVFDCRTPNDHYHVPLLLSPFGYTTYRGS